MEQKILQILQLASLNGETWSEANHKRAITNAKSLLVTRGSMLRFIKNRFAAVFLTRAYMYEASPDDPCSPLAAERSPRDLVFHDGLYRPTCDLHDLASR